MNLNEEEIAIINRAFEKLPSDENYQDLKILRDKQKSGMDLLFSFDGENPDEKRLDKEAVEYSRRVPKDEELKLFDDSGEAAEYVNKENAKEVLKICTFFEEYRQDFFKTPKTPKTHEENRKIIANFEQAIPYLSDKNKEKALSLIEVIGYNLPESVSKRIVDRRKRDYLTLQSMAKILKKDKNDVFRKNKLTMQSQMYVSSFFKDAEKIDAPNDVIALSDMAFAATKMILDRRDGSERKFVGSVAYFNLRADILEIKKKAYERLGDEANARQTHLDIISFRNSANRALDQGHKKFEQSEFAQTYLR